MHCFFAPERQKKKKDGLEFEKKKGFGRQNGWGEIF